MDAIEQLFSDLGLHPVGEFVANGKQDDTIEARETVERQHVDAATIATLKELGRKHWGKLHSYRGNSLDWLAKWEGGIPQSYCDCASGYRLIKQTIPPDYSTRKTAFEWGVRIHNAIRAKLRVKPISLDDAYACWRNKAPRRSNRLIITVATGDSAQAVLAATRPLMESYAQRVGADFLALTNTKYDWWGFEKFRVRYFAQQYDETLFLDSDVIVRPDCPDLFELQESGPAVWMHDDFDYLPQRDWMQSERTAVMRSEGIEDDRTPTMCLNSGVVLCTRDTAKVWFPPRDKSTFPTSHCAEQFWVERNALEMGEVGRLDRRFNCQWWMPDFETAKEHAWIIHLANCPDKIKSVYKVR